MTDTSVLVSLPYRDRQPMTLGTTHHAYALAAERFVRALTEAGLEVRTVDYPERFKDPLYGRLEGIEQAGQVHLVFRPSEDIRAIPGCYNIAWCAWEFEALKHSGLPQESILLDQVRMLQTCQEVWVPSRAARDVLAAHGVPRVRIVPAPVAAPAGERSEGQADFARLASLISVPLVSRSTGSEDDFATLANMVSMPLGGREAVRRAIDRKRLFLTVCAPHDQRDNLVSAIEGFLLATADDDDAVLLVKLVASGAAATPAGYLYRQIRPLLGDPHCVHENRIVLFSSHLDEDEMTALYRCADFYLCASVAESQNLALLDGMAHGCVPVTVRNTAMSDYVSPDNAVVIEERRFSGLLPRLAGYAAGTRLAIDFADRYQIADAIRRALALDDGARSALATAAQATVRARFDPAQIAREIEGRLAARHVAAAD